MKDYSITQWAFCFFVYCVIGWIYESIYVSVTTKKLTNRGFMRGPVIPLYGCGAIVMLWATIPFRSNIFLTYVSGMLAATLLEYITGVVMEALFKVRYWDYSDKKFNFQGHIWLAASLLWGVFTVLLVYFIQYPMDKLVCSISNKVLRTVVDVVAILFIVDLTLSVKTAIDIRNVLVRMDAVKAELSHMQRRIDIILAFAEDDVSRIRSARHERIADIIDSLEDRLALVRERIDIPDDVRDEIVELRAKVAMIKERMPQLAGVKDFLRREMLKGNPTMISKHFAESLEDLKKYIRK